MIDYLNIIVIYYSSALLIGCLAQLGEHHPYKVGVGGSSPSASTSQYAQNPSVDGRVAKRLNAADCKSATYWFRQFESAPSHHKGLLGCSQAVRQQTLTLSSHWFDPSHPSQNISLSSSAGRALDF